ncbi:MAG: SH3 domain-containing protein [Gammaproteobacteria bacterium]|nr:SH3 domain-containing protein [Gammaproteobacteria bacterium]MBU1440880.1 SH3 domain-containing protein [Gammaproteobacteria bacterium]
MLLSPLRYLVFLLALAMALPASGQQAFPFVDEAPTQPDFHRFREDWSRALKRRDAGFVLAQVHPDVRTSFGPDDGGVDGFARRWKLDDPASPFWSEMSSVMALGGSFSGDAQFSAPYVFSRWPDETEPFSHVAILSGRVPVRARAVPDSRVVATLDRVIVPSLPMANTRGDWYRIRTPGGKTGYVRRQDARSPVDYRAVFDKIDGRWLLTAFVAGD